MEFTIYSLVLKERFTFYSSEYYGGMIFVESLSDPMGRYDGHLCVDGDLAYASGREHFESICKSWYKNHVKLMRKVLNI